MKTHRLPMGCTFALLCSASLAQDRADIDRTQIIGNRELPKVLYIVPWKKPAALPLLARPPASVLDEPPATLDREVLRRQLRLEGELRERNPTPPRGATP